MPSNNLYEPNSAKIIKIGITGNGDKEKFQNYFGEEILPTIRLCQSFSLDVSILDGKLPYFYFNYLFYLTSMENLPDVDTIRKIAGQFTEPRNHLFIVVSKCENNETMLKDFSENLEKILENNIYHVTGYHDIPSLIKYYFKTTRQKKIVCHNYLFEIGKINIRLEKIYLDYINLLLQEIYSISYLKSDVYDDLMDKIDAILLSRLKQFYDDCKNKVTIESTGINAYQYYHFLSEIVDIATGYNLSSVMQTTNKEMEIVNSIIMEYHKNEMEKIIDLEKIMSILEIIAKKDRNKFLLLFDKIKTSTKIMDANIHKMEKWIWFINKSLKLGILRDSLYHLLEDIIVHKILYYTNKETDDIYPHCLYVFLLSNLNKNFIFKKLLMFLVLNLQYSNKNIHDMIRSLKPEQYQNLLILENKLLELCVTSHDEVSQPMILSEVDIVETFN